MNHVRIYNIVLLLNYFVIYCYFWWLVVTVISYYNIIIRYWIFIIQYIQVETLLQYKSARCLYSSLSKHYITNIVMLPIRDTWESHPKGRHLTLKWYINRRDQFEHTGTILHLSPTLWYTCSCNHSRLSCNNVWFMPLNI